MKKVKITERGWPGLDVIATSRSFRRNTLIDDDDEKTIVVTVELENGIYYETLAFKAKENGLYIEADTSQQVFFNSVGKLTASTPDVLLKGVDNVANDMHDNVVKEIKKRMEES